MQIHTYAPSPLSYFGRNIPNRTPPQFIYGEICLKETMCNLSVGEKK